MDLAEHTWVADTSKTDVPATCIAGKHFEKCSVCGETRETAIPKDPDADHDFGEWTIVTPATCAQGQKKRVCSRCGLEDFAVIPPEDGIEHVWGNKETVAGDAENGYVGYEKQVCSVCGTWKVFMKVADGTLDECDYTDSGQTKHGISELKTGDLELTGGYKLSKNGMSFSFKFKFDTLADVKIYQHGCMDNWSNNGNMNRTYYDGGNEAQGKCNFEFEVNGAKVTIDKETAKKKAQELVATRADDDPLKTIECPSGGTGYSEYGELFIGEAELVNGDNTFTYRRLGSYNYILDEIIVEVTPVDHVHEAGENWVDTDDTYHWKNCTHSDGHKMNKAEHDYTDQVWEVVTPSTCTTKGTHRRACKVCGHWQVEEMPYAEHKLGDAQAKIGDATPYECSECHAMVYDLEMASPAKIKADTSWNVTGLPAGKYDVYIKACCASTTQSTALNSRYQYGFDGTYVKPADGAYSAYGLGVGESVDNAVWSSVVCQVEAGASVAQFTVHFTSSGYSAFYVAVRLAKVAA